MTVDGPGDSRRQLVSTLNAAYADGLLSEQTFLYRLDQLLKARLIDPSWVVGDLNFRGAGRGLRARVSLAARRVASWLGRSQARPLLLALDWSGAQHELLLGRHHGCDIVLSQASVSRRHARLFFRDGSWVLQDLESTNGTLVNGVAIGRCALLPGDEVVLGDARLQID